MARMIPNVDPADIEHRSEVPVYMALRDQLPSSFTVLHSYPWLRPWRDQGALAEGETDFVVLHRRFGLLVLEVKGGKDIRHDGQKWYRSSTRGPIEFKDPFDQARRNMHALLEIVEQRSGGRVTRRDLAYGYAVVFPHVDYMGEPPPNSDRAIVISRRDLVLMERKVLAAFKAWRKHPKKLRKSQYGTLLNDCLMPKFRIIRRIGPDIASASDRLLELTEQQAQVFEGLYAQDRVLVEGVAGSGKTFLALQRAISFSGAGKRTLFVCFNRALAKYLRRRVHEDPIARRHQTDLDIRNFHALAKDLADKADIAFCPADGGPRNSQFWDEYVPDLLEKAVLMHECRGEDVRYDALVVDEAQDFPLEWWYVLIESILRNEKSPIYAFLDPNQSLRGQVQRPPIAFQMEFHMSRNCRNTRKIARASAALLDLEYQSFSRAPLGVNLRIVRVPSQARQKDQVLNELRRLLSREGVQPQQVALIAPSAKGKGSVAEVDKVNGVPLTTDVATWQDGHAVLVTTSRSFKGLEADIVLLYDLSDFGNLFEKQDLYVACTRAKFLLIAIIHGDECRAVMEAALLFSEAET